MSKICVITGSSSGLGHETVLGLAEKENFKFILINRNEKSNQVAMQNLRKKSPNIRIERVYTMDLFNLDEVISVSKNIRVDYPSIDVLILNAGVMFVPFKLSKYGIESHFQINFVSNKLITDILIPSLLNSNSDSPGRVICLSSIAHQWSYRQLSYASFSPSNINYGHGLVAYGDSKLAVGLWIKQMAKMHKNIKFFSVHPGICRTNLFRHLEESFCSKIFHFLLQWSLRSPLVKTAEQDLYLPGKLIRTKISKVI
jgi:retinol dehydrogenase-12